MLLNLVIVVALMLGAAVIISKVYRFPRNIWVLFVTYPLLLAISPIITLIAGLLAKHIAPSEDLATLPLTFMITGVACSTFIAAKLAQRVGRKKATMMGFILAIIGGLIAMQAARIGNFNLLLTASLCLGASIAFAQQMRFAGIESVDSDSTAKVVSTLMISGIFAAFIGPEIAVIAKDWIDSPFGYAGSFLAFSCLAALGLIIFQLFENPEIEQQTDTQTPTRPLTEIMRQPIFIIAILSGAIGYGLMSFLMTATPLSMHEMNGHTLADTKWVIQSHIAAMFLPSLVTGFLVLRFGLEKILLVGTITFAITAVIALLGQQLMHYWWALVLLGIAWNFLFLTGTVLLPKSYRHEERFKVQALNDFLVFFTQAFASLMSGWLLFRYGWNSLIYISMPFIVIMFLVSIYFFKYQKKTRVN